MFDNRLNADVECFTSTGRACRMFHHELKDFPSPMLLSNHLLPVQQIMRVARAQVRVAGWLGQELRQLPVEGAEGG